MSSRLPQTSQFKLSFLTFTQVDYQHADLYKKAADCFCTVWQDLYEQHGVDDPFSIDDLTRQDEVACIYTNEKCVALMLYRVVDFSLIDYRLDSYFKMWNERDLEILLHRGPRVFTATYLTVLPEFRKFSPEFRFKEVLLNIMIRRFFRSDADVISGITRRDRGIHDESYLLGAEMVRENADYLDGRFKIDLVAFYREKARESQNPSVLKFTDQIWKQHLDLTAPGFHKKAA